MAKADCNAAHLRELKCVVARSSRFQRPESPVGGTWLRQKRFFRMMRKKIFSHICMAVIHRFDNTVEVQAAGARQDAPEPMTRAMGWPQSDGDMFKGLSANHPLRPMLQSFVTT